LILFRQSEQHQELYLQPFISLEEACCDRGFFFYMNVQLLGERNVEAESRPVRPVQRFPGLNPIENFWRIVKREIAQQPIARSVVDLQQEAWDSIPSRTTQTLIDSMPSRIAVIAEKGGHTNY
jgi:hypothetical protein